MRYSIIFSLVLCCGCMPPPVRWALDSWGEYQAALPENDNELQYITTLNYRNSEEYFERVKDQRSIYLPNLESMDGAARNDFINWKGGGAQLGLRSIDKDVASQFAQWKGYDLELYIETIDVDTAYVFVDKWKPVDDPPNDWSRYPKSLNFRRLKSIDPLVASVLARFEGRLYLPFETLDEDVGVELAAYKGQDLYLYHLKAVTKNVLALLKNNPRITLSESFKD